MSFGPHPVAIARAEEVWIGIDFCLNLGASETLVSVSVSWQDEDGNTTSLQTGSPAISGTRAQVLKGANKGTPGTTYYATFVVTTSEDRVLGGERLGTIQIDIADLP